MPSANKAPAYRTAPVGADGSGCPRTFRASANAAAIAEQSTSLAASKQSLSTPALGFRLAEALTGRRTRPPRLGPPPFLFSVCFFPVSTLRVCPPSPGPLHCNGVLVDSHSVDLASRSASYVGSGSRHFAPECSQRCRLDPSYVVRDASSSHKRGRRSVSLSSPERVALIDRAMEHQ